MGTSALDISNPWIWAGPGPHVLEEILKVMYVWPNIESSLKKKKNENGKVNQIAGFTINQAKVLLIKLNVSRKT